MPPETGTPVLISLKEALTQFAFPEASVQTSRHIIPLHWYVACRLVIEGGFHPDRIFPRPPITVKRRRGGLKEGRYAAPDLAFQEGGELTEPIKRYRQALLRLSERDDLRDPPSRYEACGLTFVKAKGGPSECGAYAGHPDPKLDYNRMFRRLYAIFDRRFVYTAATLRSRTKRQVWDRESPLLTETIKPQDAFAEMEPRVG